MTRFVKDEHGRLRTVDGPAPIDLERARRECRDVIQGNVPFHADPFAKPVPVVEAEPVQECFCAYLGGECETCRDA